MSTDDVIDGLVIGAAVVVTVLYLLKLLTLALG